MCEFTDLMLADCQENAGGVGSIAYAIPAHDLDTIANTYAEDATYFADDVAYSDGDLVIYQGSVYSTVVAGHAAGAWDDADFDLVANGNVRINGAHTPATGKGFTKLFINDDESLFEFLTNGKKFNRNGKLDAKLYHPGNSVEASEFNHQLNVARNVIVLIPLPDGRIVQIGSENNTAEMFGAYQSGTRENPDSRWLFNAMAYARSVTYYEGAITLKP